jgi:hypothetical protein
VTASINPLDRLVVDEAAVDLELLASTLEGAIRIDLKQGGFAFLQGVRARLSKRQQVLIALLARKALHLLDSRHSEALRPQEIEALTGVKGGTLRPILKQLNDRRVIRQDESQSYYVPGYALEDAAALLAELGE